MKTLDLHGTKHEDVERKVLRFVESCWMNTEEEAEIITGHSDVMRKLALEVLKEYGAEAHIGGLVGVDQTFIRVIF